MGLVTLCLAVGFDYSATGEGTYHAPALAARREYREQGIPVGRQRTLGIEGASVLGRGVNTAAWLVSMLDQDLSGNSFTERNQVPSQPIRESRESCGWPGESIACMNSQ